MKYFTLIILALGLALSACEPVPQLSQFEIIPEPQELIINHGSFSFKDTAGLISFQISENELNGGIEAYEIEVNTKGIHILGNSATGLFYGLQTLNQLLPPAGLKGEIKIPCLSIKDWPAFAWRGGMLDVSRHFFSKEFILKYIDILAFHKMNHFHWHLTDGTAWRLEIDAYPELTALVDSYSKEDVREIVEYATSRFITIIPEIEMPGHSDAALSIFPELSCNPELPSGVYCAGKEESFIFLETVLQEVIELFPAEIIHVGGDEVGKGQWQACSHCQQRIQEEGLANEEELQSYFIKRIAAFLNKQGKTLIGWDEILEGGLPDGAHVMSWRGMTGGIAAASQGHDVVMSPGYPCYFDHYQSGHSDEPQAWGGLNRLRDVYGFNPVPKDLPSEQAHHILGAQANLWTEQVATPDHAEYMMMPRYSALAEVLWSGQDRLDWDYFEQKMMTQLLRYEALDYNYSKSAFTPNIQTQFIQESGNLEVEFSRELNFFPLHYSLDGSDPTSSSAVCVQKLLVQPGMMLRAVSLRSGQPFGYEVKLEGIPNKVTGKQVTYHSKWEPAYPGGEEQTLTDGKLATKRGDHPNWQGFRRNDLDVVIDLHQSEKISSVWIQFFQHAGMTRVMLPEWVAVYGSVNSVDYELLVLSSLEIETKPEAFIRRVSLSFEATEIRYLRFFAKNPEVLHPEHPRAGMDAWLFIDEIGVL